MPIITKPVSELTQHVLTPLIQQMSHRILDFLSYSDVIGDQIFIDTDWTTHSKTSDINGNVIPGVQSFRVEALTQLNPTSQKFDIYTFHHTAAYGIGTKLMNYFYPIFLDNKNKIRIIEKRSPVTIVLNCELTLQSADLAFQTPQQIFNGHENGSVYHYNDLVYDYPVPKTILQVIYGLWKMDRQYGKPAGVKFIDFINERTEGTWQAHRHREFEQYEIVVPVRNLQTLGTLEYNEDKPTGVMKERLAVGWSIPFIYTFQFEMPTINILQFPCILNNQLVPAEYIPINTNNRHNTLEESHRIIPRDRHYTAYENTQENKLRGYLQVPSYDDWIVPENAEIKLNDHTPVAILSLLVDEDKEYTDTDLSVDFDENIRLTNLVKEFLYQQGEESLNNDSVYGVALFKDDRQLVPHLDYTFDENLILRFKPADFYAHYRIVVTAATDINKINPKWYSLLKKWYPLLGGSLQWQIENAISTGSWRNPNWPDGTYIGKDGVIYDKYGRPIDKLENSKYPYTYADGGINGYSTDSRVITSEIIARSPKNS